MLLYMRNNLHALTGKLVLLFPDSMFTWLFFPVINKFLKSLKLDFILSSTALTKSMRIPCLYSLPLKSSNE